MKKILSLLLTAVIIAAAAAVYAPLASAADKGTLTITSRGEVIGEVEVGNEFIYHVSLDSAGYSVMSAQGELRGNPDYAEIVEYGTVKSSGAINMDAYSFPQRIRNSSLVSNYFALYKNVEYNFTKLSSVGSFTPEDHFFKVRMKAVAPGTVELRHYIELMYHRTDNNEWVRLIHHDQGNTKLNPVPYTVCSIEPAAGYVGDADGDYNLTVMDATFVQRLTAGVDSTYNSVSADTDGNGEINLRDALNILRYKAGVTTDTNIGEWIFESEQQDG